MVDVIVEDLVRAPFACLVDTGTLVNRFDAGIATFAGIDLAGAPEESVRLPAGDVVGRSVVVRLRLGGFSWEAPVSFCNPWPAEFQLLGQEGFLRWFRLTCEVANSWMELDPLGD